MSLQAARRALLEHFQSTGLAVVAVHTNPGSRESWPFQRFLADDHDPHRVACHIPSRDRLSDEQIEAQGRPTCAPA